MNPFADKIEEQKLNVEDAKHPHDLIDSNTQRTDYKRSRIIPAVVTEISGDYTDEWVVDLYDHGYTLPNGTDGPVTRKAVKAHPLHNGDWFEVGDKINVRLMPDNSAWIIHEETPILGIITDKGPNDEDEETDTNFYWVAFARIWDATDGGTNDIKVFDKMVKKSKDKDVDGVQAPDSHSEDTKSVSWGIVRAENISEHKDTTHNLEKDTVVTLKWTWDLQVSAAPKRRWFFESASSSGLFPASGRFKLMQITDDLNPGTWGADYLRFSDFT